MGCAPSSAAKSDQPGEFTSVATAQNYAPEVLQQKATPALSGTAAAAKAAEPTPAPASLEKAGVVDETERPVVDEKSAQEEAVVPAPPPASASSQNGSSNWLLGWLPEKDDTAAAAPAPAPAPIPTEPEEQVEPKPPIDWRSQLTYDEHRVLREKHTEPAGSGEYDRFYPPEGHFVCRGCGNALFSAAVSSCTCDMCGPVRLGARSHGRPLPIILAPAYLNLRRHG